MAFVLSYPNHETINWTIFVLENTYMTLTKSAAVHTAGNPQTPHKFIPLLHT